MRAKVGQEAALLSFFEGVVIPSLKGADGMQVCHLLQNQVDPTRFVMIELWDTIEAHQASVKMIDPKDIEQVMKLLAETPRGEYFSDNGVA
jgi:quinol monooxygenase YgiN